MENQTNMLDDSQIVDATLVGSNNRLGNLQQNDHIIHQQHACDTILAQKRETEPAWQGVPL